MKKRVITAACALLLSLSVCGCSAEKLLTSLSGNSGKWIDSDLTGAISADEEYREQDDFAAAVNADWKLEVGDTFCSLFQEITDQVMINKKQIVKDASIPGVTAERLRAYYDLASGWDDRNADGAEPLRPYIEDIESIGSKEELYAYFADPVRNPLYLSPIMTMLRYVVHSGVYEDRYAVYFTSPELSLSSDEDNSAYFSLNSGDAFERFLQVKDKAAYMLNKLGYSDREASDLIGDCMAWEKRVVEADNKERVADPDKFTYPREEAVSMSGEFPFETIINAWGFEETEYFILNPDYMKKLDQLCADRYLKQIRAFLIVNYCLRCSNFLDRETFDQMDVYDKPRQELEDNYGMSDEQKEDAWIFDYYIGSTSMCGAMNRVYVENFFDDAQIGELTSITEELIDTFREIFSEEEWLSEEGKEACIEKLNAMNVHIAYQDFDSVDYGKMKFQTHEEGGNFLEAYFASRRFGMEHTAWLSEQSYDAAYWDPIDPGISTTETNAAYIPTTNGIYIYAGVCEAPAYSPQMSFEEKLGGLFAIVGHEITHGFDKGGALYDKDGIRNSWLPMEDQQAFNDKNDDVGAYYTTLTPFEGSGLYAGTLVNAEATADMGGLKAVLRLAEKEKDFDYDLFFRSYANLWKTNVPMEYEKLLIAGDVHPLAFYRINVGLQQFDEFYETYGVAEGDGMYLDPDRRIKVW